MRIWLMSATVFVCVCVTIFLLIRRKKKTGNQNVDFYYFYTTWCPYCKKSMVEWTKFKQEWNKKTYQGYTLYFHEVDCDIEETLANKYNVTQYPTIKMIKDDTVHNFDAKPSLPSLTAFLNANFE